MYKRQVSFVISLGPEPSFDGILLTTTGPYDWLLSIIPGFDGLRVPARAAIAVFLGLAVLASIAMRCLVDRLSRRAAIAVTLVVMAVIAAEGYHTRRMVPFHPDGPEAERATTEWLRQLPPGPAIVLPFYERTDHVPNTMRSVYATLEHGHPLVNGFSGFSTPLVRYFEDSTKLRDYRQYNDVLNGLRAVGVRYVVIHGHRFRNAEEVSILVAAIQNEVEHLEIVSPAVAGLLRLFARVPPQLGHVLFFELGKIHPRVLVLTDALQPDAIGFSFRPRLSLIHI